MGLASFTYTLKPGDQPPQASVWIQMAVPCVGSCLGVFWGALRLEVLRPRKRSVRDAKECAEKDVPRGPPRGPR